jgi:hypothetical protein
VIQSTFVVAGSGDDRVATSDAGTHRADPMILAAQSVPAALPLEDDEDVQDEEI